MVYTGQDIDYDLLPGHLRGGVREYIEHGRLPGHFLTAVIKNDLGNACSHADETCRLRLFDIVSFFYNEVPSDCWGTPDRVRTWHDHSGLAGINRPGGP